jgi:flagellar protein FliO/FliZ
MSISIITVTLGALALVVGLLAVIHRLAAHFKLPQRLSGSTGPAGVLAIDQTLSLDPRRRLLLINCAGRQVLLLTGGPQDVLVGWLETKA